MATREENLKKINTELEKLTDEELDQVAGGTWDEYQDIAKHLPKVRWWYQSYLGKSRWMERDMEPEEVKDYLKKTYNIDSHINAYTLFKRGGAPNEYSRDGVSMSHAEVMELITSSQANN